MKHTLLFLSVMITSLSLQASNRDFRFNKKFQVKPLFKKEMITKKVNFFQAPNGNPADMFALYAPSVSTNQVLGLEYLPYFFQGDGITGIVRSGRFFFDKPFGRHFGMSSGISFNYYQISGSFTYGYYYPNSTHGNLLHINTTDISFGVPLYSTWNFTPGRKWNVSAFAGATILNYTAGNSFLTFSDGTQTVEKGGKLNFVWKYNNAFLRSDEIGFEMSHAFRKIYTIGFGAGISPTYLMQQLLNRNLNGNPITNQFPLQFHFKVGRIMKRQK